MQVLSKEQIETYVEDGVLVAQNIISADELKKYQDGLHRTLKEHGVDPENLKDTAQNLLKLSSTNGSGGVLDIFYQDFQLEIGSNEKLFRATQQLWRASLAYDEKSQNREYLSSIGKEEMYHQFGAFDPSKGYMYIDRLGYRIPTALAEEIGEQVARNSCTKENTKKNKKKKNMAIQRSLTPHFDVCPDTFYSNDKSKWRPIQCFVALSDTPSPNMGGFEAAKQFHRHFHTWRQHRAFSEVTRKDPKSGAKRKEKIPAPCLGEYTHIRPQEDESVMKAVKHVPIKAGDVVFWDQRIPHANAYKNESEIPRAVVYCSFLPDVAVNRNYARKQLEDYENGKKPRDTWIDFNEESQNVNFHSSHNHFQFSELGEKLMMIQKW